MELVIKENRSKFGFDLNGIKTQQRKEVFDIFPPFLKKEMFGKVLEIGTHHGGFSSYLYELSKTYDFIFKTYDIGDYLTSVRKVYEKVPFDFTQTDVWDGEGKHNIIEEISDDNKCLVLIDGGDKNKEYNIYAPFLKLGDIIMTHDYAPNRKYFNNHIFKKKWLYLESWDEKLEWKQNNLLKVYPQFQDVVWSCFRKIEKNHTFF